MFLFGGSTYAEIRLQLRTARYTLTRGLHIRTNAVARAYSQPFGHLSYPTRDPLNRDQRESCNIMR